MIIRPPRSAEDFADYFHLRWEILRSPWQQPAGSEKDEFEDIAYHVMATDDTQIVGVGRVHSLDGKTGQIRYMAVKTHKQRQGIGAKILVALEQHAYAERYQWLTLNARDTAVDFYLQHGYQRIGNGPVLYGQITHTQMRKELT